mgnify:CR=1 FL=1
MLAVLGPLYWVAAFVRGAAFLLYAIRLYFDPTTAAAMRLFAYSITYITLLFGAMAIDQLVRHV